MSNIIIDTELPEKNNFIVRGLMKIAIDTTDAIREMEEANRIIEDFPTAKYGFYALLFLVEIALCFWIASRL
jgi:hypothetical protein